MKLAAIKNHFNKGKILNGVLSENSSHVLDIEEQYMAGYVQVRLFFNKIKALSYSTFKLYPDAKYNSAYHFKNRDCQNKIKDTLRNIKKDLFFGSLMGTRSFFIEKQRKTFSPDEIYINTQELFDLLIKAAEQSFIDPRSHKHKTEEEIATAELQKKAFCTCCLYSLRELKDSIILDISNIEDEYAFYDFPRLKNDNYLKHQTEYDESGVYSHLQVVKSPVKASLSNIPYIKNSY